AAGVPDPGVPPVATGPVVPGSTTVTTNAQAGTTVVGPMASQILGLRAQVEALGERLTKIDLDLQAATQATQRTSQAWQDAKVQSVQLQQQADSAAAKAYKQASQLGPLGGYANDVGQLNELVPGGLVGADGSPRSKVLDAATAAALERSAEAAYAAAIAAQQQLTEQQASLKASRDQQAAQLADLSARNAAAVQEAQAVQDAADAQLSGQFAAGTAPQGAASAIARAAVAAA